ncbi:MAG: NUDIX hydrolase [Pseudonocardiaceae bacterium]
MEIDSLWKARASANPRLFDGPILAARSVDWDGARCTVRWSRASYAQYLWRYGPEEVVQCRFARALFVSVLAQTADGQVLLGRMAPDTSTPGRVQLPGGNVRPPDEGAPLTAHAVREHAVRELAEETGVELAPSAASLWAVKDLGAFGDVGIMLRADVPAAGLAHQTFQRHLQGLAAAGQTPEFTCLLSVRRSDGPLRGQVAHPGLPLLEALSPHVDYLPAVLHASLGVGPLTTSESSVVTRGWRPGVRG